MAEEKEIVLSYIMTTFNKLSFLKITLPHLIAACKADEEIVIVDGGSTDGTKEYLQELCTQKKIHRFISEKDAGEAHGTNKAMFLSKGKLIKIITDDDFFDYDAIAYCREMMLKLNLDVIGGNGIGCTLPYKKISNHPYDKDFLNWQKNKKPIFFSGLSLLINRQSLPLLGLFHTGIRIVDFEYVLRITSLPIKLGFYTGNIYCNVVNSQSNSANFLKRFYEEQVKLDLFYKGKKTNNNQRLRYKLSAAIKGEKKPEQSEPINIEEQYTLLLEVFKKARLKTHTLLHA
ncbi:MAG: glycosyltransferase [Bacteroidia bacterium]|nr:glycosyltransferase [Bacteroidia bacterium]